MTLDFLRLFKRSGLSGKVFAGLLVLARLSSASVDIPSPKAAWLAKQNITVYFQPPLDYLRTTGATGTTWSVFYQGLNAEELSYVNLLRTNGFRVGSNFPTAQGNVTTDTILQKTACCRDIHNKPQTFIGNQYAMCHNNPAWQAFLQSRIKEHIDGGVDSVHIDEIANIGIHGTGGFCPYCLAVLNSYLQARYTAAQLKSKFGIQNIQAFDYRVYLLSQGAESIWEDPNEDLRSDYLQAQFLSRAKVMRQLIQAARSYGKGKVLFSGNLYGLYPNQQICMADLDFVVFEQPIGKLPAGKLIWTYLLAEAMAPAKAFVGFPDIYDLAGLTSKDWPLFRHWLAEAFACGASFLLPYQAYSASVPYTLPADKIEPYTTFLRANVGLYRNATRLARVALYHDLYSLNTNTVCWKAHVGWSDFTSMGRKLQETHVPFGVVYKGDSRYYSKALAVKDLKPYAAVVLPVYTVLDAASQAVFDQYESGGGVILRADDFPSGSDVVSELRKKGVDTGLTTNASKDLGIVMAKQGRSLLVHLINYKYSAGGHRFARQRQIRVTAAIPAGVALAGKTLQVLSPDSQQTVILAYTIQGGSVTFTVPDVDIYSLCVFR